ncbi:hypothetical protein BHF71_06355 [Vulcanibacillus modesticaldus]|uniref:ATP-grasp domain-containing protein n=1 Tax=Vulcanibacillus modesticaldus TaxID=337097 RepID=A0A1D2YWJ0_9BACI|nr:YheC/YheD family protein [Vulcanibacillus modesticaldus]OEG00064.1 hypothetical protein BHF71_06355 [Vulcanibacillus modesticaldus]
MTLVTIQIDQQFLVPNTIYVNPTIVNKLNLPINKAFLLSFGNKTASVRLELRSNKSNLIRISSYVANLLQLPNGIQIHAKYHKSTGLILGPILGILVQSIENNQPHSPFGKFTSFANEVTHKAYTNGILPYFFTVDDINIQTGDISGWRLIGEKWEKGTFPVPNVIYNRISSRRAEKMVLPKINQLQQKYTFTFFNSNFLNKWEVYKILIRTPIRTIIPKTIVYRGYKSIKEMLANHSIIYLKPTNGSLGRGIIKINKISNGYIVDYTRAQSSTTVTFNSFTKMYKYLQPRLSRNYLIQMGINLIKYQNRPIDFRILVQKNSSGKWSLTSMVARIARDQHIVSNIAQGGTQSKVMAAIRLANPDLAKKIRRRDISKIALLIANYIEKASDGNFAELGIDLGLDDSGKIWLIEVNSKPSKLDDQREINAPRPSVNRLIQYVLYITDFK